MAAPKTCPFCNRIFALATPEDRDIYMIDLMYHMLGTLNRILRQAGGKFGDVRVTGD